MKTWQEVEQEEFIHTAKADAARWRRLEHELDEYKRRVDDWNKKNPTQKSNLSSIAVFVDDLLDERATMLAVSKDRVERAKDSADPSRVCKSLSRFPSPPEIPPQPSTEMK